MMQHWIKDMKYSTRVKDEEGYPAMALVNKASGEALKHSLGQSHPVTNLLCFSSSIQLLILLSDACVHGRSYMILAILDISEYLQAHHIPHIPNAYFLCIHTSSDSEHEKQNGQSLNEQKHFELIGSVACGVSVNNHH